MNEIKIELTQGQVAVIDAEDWDKVKDFKWNANKRRQVFYAVTEVKGKAIYMHKLILPGVKLVDHVSGDGLDNRKVNLRSGTKQTNGTNRGKQSNNTSGYKGVHWNKIASKFTAHLGSSNTYVSLGYFNSAFEAALAYDRALTEWAGAYGGYNF